MFDKFKKGDKSDVDNYRPVSLTSIVCKLLESIIKDKMVEFFDENDLIKDSQYGFRKNRSCLTNLLKFLNVATEAFDEGEQLDVTYLDFSKAFDKVPHKRLCLQLKCHGISGKTPDWIEHWLSGRQQRVLLNPRPAGVWIVTRPAGGGGQSPPPLRSPKLLDRFPNFKRHSIALYVN